MSILRTTYAIIFLCEGGRYEFWIFLHRTYLSCHADAAEYDLDEKPAGGLRKVCR